MVDMHERDVVATDEMIRNLRAGTFRKVAIGVGAAGAGLLLGASLLVWTWKQGNDPEVLKEALRQMPPLNVTVTLDPASKVTLADGATVTLVNPPVMPAWSGGTGGGSHDPAIQTNVTVFKTVDYGRGEISTGWKFANGAAKTPEFQYCHYKQELGGSGSAIQSVGQDGVMMPAPTGVKDQRERFQRCQWFKGDLG